MVRLIFFLLVLGACSQKDKKVRSSQSKPGSMPDSAYQVTVTDPFLVEAVENLLEAYDSLDMKKVMVMIYQPALENISAEHAANSLEKGMNNESVSTRISDTRIDSIYPEFIISNTHYAKVKVSMKTIVAYKRREGDTREAMMNDINAYAASMSEKIGAGNVKVDRERCLVEMRTPMEFLAINEKDLTDIWFFFILDNPELVKKNFPSDVVTRLSEFK